MHSITATPRTASLLALSLLAGSFAAAPALATGPINTNPAGSASPQPFNNVQPSLAIHFSYQLQGTAGNGVPVRMFAYADAKMAQLNATGWLSPTGQVLSIQQNASLYAQLGTTYGGNGVNTFMLPDLRGRTPIGEGQGFQASNYLRGQVVGQPTITLTTAQLPAHTHTHGKAVTGITGSAGGGQAVTNIQPSLAMNYSITTAGTFPINNAVSTPVAPFTGQVLLHSATPTGGFTSIFSPANGQTIPVSQNTALFALIGTFYGGNGQSTFGKPDLRGSTASGIGQGPGVEARVMGEMFGSELCLFNATNLPPHSHTVPGIPALPATGITGGAQPFSNAQRTLALNYCVALTGATPGAGGMSDQTGYIGEIILFAGSVTPPGHIRCEGQFLSIQQNAALYALMGTAFGGNGTTTFALPDLRGRIAVGASLGAGGTPAGTVLGTENITLTTANMPAHTHSLLPWCPADIGKAGGLIGHDGLRDNNDFIAFITLFFLMDPWADLGIQGGLAGSDGMFDNNDFIAFIDAFFADCPW